MSEAPSASSPSTKLLWSFNTKETDEYGRAYDGRAVWGRCFELLDLHENKQCQDFVSDLHARNDLAECHTAREQAQKFIVGHESFRVQSSLANIPADHASKQYLDAFKAAVLRLVACTRTTEGYKVELSNELRGKVFNLARFPRFDWLDHLLANTTLLDDGQALGELEKKISDFGNGVANIPFDGEDALRPMCGFAEKTESDVTGQLKRLHEVHPDLSMRIVFGVSSSTTCMTRTHAKKSPQWVATQLNR